MRVARFGSGEAATAFDELLSTTLVPDDVSWTELMRSWNICRRWAVVGALNTSSSSPFLAWNEIQARENERYSCKTRTKIGFNFSRVYVKLKCYLVDRAVAITSLFCTHVGHVTVGVVFLLFDCRRRAGTQRRRASDGHGSRTPLILCRPFVGIESRRRFGSHERLK